MKKIAYIIPRFHPFKGGAERNIEALAERAVKDGYDVTVITTNIKFRNEALAPVEEYKGMKIVRNWAVNEWLYAGFYPDLLTTLLKDDYDIVHASGIGFLWREFCMIMKKNIHPNTKFIVTPHGPFMSLNDTTGFRGFARMFYTKIISIFAPWLFDAVISVAPTQHEWITDLYKIPKDKIHLIPNGIDKSYLEKEVYEPKLESSKITLSYINRMERYKGVQDIIKAVGIIKDKRKSDPDIPEIEFIAMGRAGNYTQKLKELVTEEGLEKEVEFIFSPTDEQRDEIFYTKSHINILASKWEATGIALIEAMAKGNAIITTTGNDAKELIIRDGENGYIYEYGDYKTLAKYILKLAKERELLNQMIRFNIDYAKNFTWEAIYPDYKKLIKDL